MQLATMAATATMSSREIAELTGKELSHIHRDIRAMLDELGAVDDPELDHVREDKDARGYTACFHLTKSLSMTLVSGYSIKLRKAIIDRWQELEAKHKPPAQSELSRMQILQLAMESEQARIKAESERDEAIRTKAQIGSRREATAMASASAARREAARLKEQLGACAKHATVRAVEGVTGKTYDWINLRRWCKAIGQSPVSVADPLYGAVKAWPAKAWADCYKVDLLALFGGDK